MNEDELEDKIIEANDLFNQRNHQQCIRICEEVLSVDPNNASAALLCASSYQLLRESRKAISLFEKHLSDVREESFFWNLYCFSLLNSGLIKQAKTEFTDMKNANIEDMDICYSYGYFCVFNKQYYEGIKWLTKAQSLGNNTVKVYYNRGVGFYNLNQYDEAIEDMEKVLELEPDYNDAAIVLAKIYHQHNLFEKALEYYSRVIYYDPENRKIVFDRLLLLVNLKDENGFITKHALAQHDADTILPYADEFFKLTSKDGEPFTIKKIMITEQGHVNFDVE